MTEIVERLRALAPIKEALEAADEIVNLYNRVADLERDLSIEVAAGHDATERAEAAERELNELRAKWAPLVTWAAAKDKAGKGDP